MTDLGSKFVGVWSHGVIHNYYGGSHDYRLVLHPDGIGSYCHDGWWVYRYALFRWALIEGDVLRIYAQRYRVNHDMPGNGRRIIQVKDRPIRLDFDAEHGMERLVLPLVDEPIDFYLISREPDVVASQLHAEYLDGE